MRTQRRMSMAWGEGGIWDWGDCPRGCRSRRHGGTHRKGGVGGQRVVLGAVERPLTVSADAACWAFAGRGERWLSVATGVAWRHGSRSGRSARHKLVGFAFVNGRGFGRRVSDRCTVSLQVRKISGGGRAVVLGTNAHTTLATHDRGVGIIACRERTSGTARGHCAVCLTMAIQYDSAIGGASLW